MRLFIFVKKNLYCLQLYLEVSYILLHVCYVTKQARIKLHINRDSCIIGFVTGLNETRNVLGQRSFKKYTM